MRQPFYSNNTIITEAMPATPTTIPDIAASTSPISTALALPSMTGSTNGDAGGNAIIHLKTLIIRGNNILPKIPVTITAAVRAGMPPKVLEISIAIGVVVVRISDLVTKLSIPSQLQAKPNTTHTDNRAKNSAYCDW